YMLITINSGLEIIILVLVIIDYKKIQKKKKFNGGLQANHFRKTAGLGDIKWQITPGRLQV
ncbi:MAG: hypothetical protein WCB90_11480, partial [Methanosarcina sp.]